MKIIVLVAVLGVVLLQLSGGLTDASVGGPLTLMMVFVLAALAVGIHDAWSNKRGVFGWIVNIPISVVGGLVTVAVGGLMMEEMLPGMNLEGSLVSSRHPIAYVFLAAMMILTLLGAWAALWLVNRLR
jgi:hypothetical protein